MTDNVPPTNTNETMIANTGLFFNRIKKHRRTSRHQVPPA